MNITSAKAENHHWVCFSTRNSSSISAPKRSGECSRPRPVPTKLCDLEEVPAVLWISVQLGWGGRCVLGPPHFEVTPLHPLFPSGLGGPALLTMEPV